MIFATPNLLTYSVLYQNPQHEFSIMEAIKLIPLDSVIAGAIVISAVIILIVILMLILRRKKRQIHDNTKSSSNTNLNNTVVELAQVKELYALSKNENAKLEYLYNNSVFGIITLSAEGEIRSVNRVASLLLHGTDLLTRI